MSSNLTQAAGSPRTASQDDISTGELLELLGDEYTRRVLRAVIEEPRSGTAVTEAADVSKATAYRRLDALEEAGLVVSETVFNPNGYHHERYRAVVEEIELRFEAGELVAKVAVDQDSYEPSFPNDDD